MTIPPTQEPPAFTFEMPERRNIGGWLVLIAIFSLMIGVQLAKYFDRDVKRPEAKYMGVARQLKLGVEMRQTMVLLGARDNAGVESTLLAVEKELWKDTKGDVIAARLFAASRSERGAEIPDEIIAKLNASKERRDPLFAEIFSAKKIELTRAKELEKELAGGGFVSKLARIHAFEKAGDSSRRGELISQSRAVFRLSVISIAALSFMAGLILWVIYFVLRAQGLLPTMGLPMERISLPDADKLALRCAQLFVMFLAAPLAIGWLVSAMGIGKHFGNLVLYGALLVAAIWLFKFPIGLRKFSLREIGIAKENFGKHFAWGFATALANLPLVLAAAWLGQWIFSGLPAAEHPTTVEIETGVGLFGTLVIAFAASIGAPILEEIMFRGTLLPALARVMNRPVAAILIQGLIFAAIHPTGVPAWLPLATIGAMSGFLSRQTGSLVPSIVMHAVHNFGTLLVAQAVLGNSG